MWVSVLIISILGTFLHFLYEISNHNKVVALFAAVNESTWEHIKIALTATFFWSLYDGALYGQNSNYFIAKTISLLVIIILMPLLFYSYTFFTKKAILPIDIICFYIVIICSQLTFNYFINLNPLPFTYKYFSVIGLFIIFGFYMVLTLMPFKNFLFKDPISKKYGKAGHTEFKHEK